MFLYIDEKRKLNFIKYNKKLQKKFGLTLIDYKRFSGLLKLKIHEKTEIYNDYTHSLLFEGFYVNEKKNGKGVEYNERGNVIFEGEYIDNQKWNGFEKEYDEDTGNLILICEYKNGKKEGKREEYDKYTGQLLFKGIYLNGKKNGKCEEYKLILKEKNNFKNDYSPYSYKSKLIKIFSGEYSNGERVKGREYNYDEKLVYEGEYLNDKKNGKGKTYDENGKLKYDGEYLNGIKNGKGIEYYREPDIKYVCEYKNGKKHGKGKEYSYNYNFIEEYYNNESNLLFEGEYMNDYKIKEKNIIEMEN